MKGRIVSSLLWGFIAVTPVWARDIALVSNKNNVISGVALGELVKVCRGETPRWPDGKPVRVVMRKPTQAEMKLVVDKVYGVSESDVIQLIAGANHARANHPAVIVVETDQDVLTEVANTPGAVGFVDVYSINSSVAVLKVGGHLPLEPGYVLHGN